MLNIRNPHARPPFRFMKNDSGAVTVEAVLWMPIFLLFFGLIVDISLIFHGQSKAQRIIQDVNRFASTGYLEDESQIKAHALARLRAFSPNAEVMARMGSEDVQTIAVIPASDLDAIGFFARISGIKMTVASVHLLEV